MTQLEKGIKDQMAWTRDQVHLLRRLLSPNPTTNPNP